MNPKPMTNDSDRVAPDRRLPLPSRTPVRLRRRIAAAVLSLLLALSCFAASPAWAYKAGQDADDRPSGIPEYDNVAAYLEDTSRNTHPYVKIGEYTLPRDQVEAFHQASILKDATKPLTDATLIKSFADTAIYLRDSDRTTRLYAYLENKDVVYRVTDLEAHNTTTNPLSDDNLPNNPVGSLGSSIDIFGNTAVGPNASATGYNATALGHGASATGDRSIAIGHGATTTPSTSFQGSQGAIAIGMESRANGWKSIAIGAHAQTNSHATIAVGRSSRATAAGGVAVGVGARAEGLNSIALGRGARATGTGGIAIGGVSVAQKEVVVGASTHTYKLPGLATTSGTRVVTVDSQGRLSTQAATSSPASPSRSASLRGAAALSAEVTPLNRDLGTRTDAADYEKAPAIGSGPEAPETAEQRRVVVQDTNRDGSVRLRTLDFGDLSGMDRRLAGVEERVTSLSDRLNKATAMSAALSALPNVVPGDNRFFFGVGAGHYSSEQALAIGMSARVGRHAFVNAGAAIASGDDASVRGGVGVVW